MFVLMLFLLMLFLMQGACLYERSAVYVEVVSGISFRTVQLSACTDVNQLLIDRTT